MLDSEHNRRIAELRRPLQEKKSGGQEEKGEKEKEDEEDEEAEEEEEEVSAPWLTPQGPGGPSLYV